MSTLFAKRRNVVNTYGKLGRRGGVARPVSQAPVSTEDEEEEEGSSQGSSTANGTMKQNNNSEDEDEKLPSLPVKAQRPASPAKRVPQALVPEVTINSPKLPPSSTKKRVIEQDPSSNETTDESQESSEGKLVTSTRTTPLQTAKAVTHTPSRTSKVQVTVEVSQRSGLGNRERGSLKKRKIEQVASSDEDQSVPSVSASYKGKGKQREIIQEGDGEEPETTSPSPKKALRKIGNFIVEDDTSNSNTRSSTSTIPQTTSTNKRNRFRSTSASKLRPTLKRKAIPEAASPVPVASTSKPIFPAPKTNAIISPSSSTFPSPPPSPPEFPPEAEPETYGDLFDGLLELEEAQPPIMGTKKKRRPLIRQMSSRRESESEAGGSSMFSSPGRTPNKPVQPGAEGYFTNALSPLRREGSSTSSIHVSPSIPQPSPSAVFGYSGREVTPSAPPGTIAQADPQSQAPIPSPPPPLAKRTYGQTRTILADADILAPLLDLSTDLGIGPSSRPTLGVPKTSYFDARRRLGSDTPNHNANDNEEEGDEEDEELEESSQSQLHGINELRSAGENRRFTDEMNYMLDGFHESQPLGVQRASAVEIIRKLRDEDWIRKLKTYDYVGQVYDHFRLVKAGEGDRILDTCLIIYIGRLVQDRKSAELLLQKPTSSATKDSPGSDSLAVLLNVLDQSWAKLSLGGNERSLGKAEKRMLSTLGDIISSPGRESQPKLSVQSMIINIFAALCSHKLPSPYTPLSLVSSSGFLSKLVNILIETLPAEHAIEISAEDALQIDACLQVLDCVAGETDQAGALVALEGIAEQIGRGLVGLVEACRGIAVTEQEPESATATDLLITTLKILVSLSSLSPIWAKAITSAGASVLPSLVKCIHLGRSAEIPHTAHSQQDGNTSTQSSSTSTGQTSRFDLLCLSFGLLECLLESSPAARLQFKSIREEGESALQTITQLYIRYQADSEQPEKEFLAKYCSLILLYGMLGHTGSQREVGAALRASEVGIGALLETMGAIRLLHSEAEKGDTSTVTGEELDSAIAEVGKYV